MAMSESESLLELLGGILVSSRRKLKDSEAEAGSGDKLECLSHVQTLQ